MNTIKFTLSWAIALFVMLAITSCSKKNNDPENTEAALPASSKEDLKSEAWQMEELYWQYVQEIDTIAYKKLWHEDFIGYPSFGDGVSNKSKIAIWIPELHEDKSLKFSYTLHKKAVNAIDEVVIVFYDADEIWTDKENKVVRIETFKFTHTWKKYGKSWVILGGMAAKKI